MDGGGGGGRENKVLLLEAQSGVKPAPALLLPARLGLWERGEGAWVGVKTLVKVQPVNIKRLLLEKTRSVLLRGNF